MPPTLSLCMIVRDSSATIAACLDSVLPYVAELVVGDTGSTDPTLELVRAAATRHGAKLTILDLSPAARPDLFVADVAETWEPRGLPGPFSGASMLANFGRARQATWDAASGDFLFWVDSDDVLEGGPRLASILAALEREKLDAAIFPYDYAKDDHGNVVCTLLRERIVRKGGAQWSQPVHEVLVPVGAARAYEEVRIVHQHKPGVGPGRPNWRNLKILTLERERELQSGQEDPRTLFYLAMESRTLFPEKCQGYLEAYVQKSGWDEEKGMAYQLLGSLHEEALRLRDAQKAYAQSFAEFSYNPDPIFALARLAFYRADYQKCLEHSRAGLELLDRIRRGDHIRRQTLMSNELDRAWRPYRYLSKALCEQGDLTQAQKAYEQGLMAVPHDRELAQGLELVKIALKAQKEPPSVEKLQLKFSESDSLDAPPHDIPAQILLSFALELWKRNMAAGFYTRAVQLLDSLPGEVALLPQVSKARAATLDKIGRNDEGLVHLQAEEMSEASRPGFEESQKKAPVAEKAPAPELSPPAAELAAPALPPGPLAYVAGKPRIVLWTGQGFEAWSPKSIDAGGIGGSETAAVCMARELRALGHEVRVISDCQGMEGNYDGVQYLDFRNIDKMPPLESDIFISSRQPQIFRANHKFLSKKNILWVHDVHCGEPNTDMESVMLMADRIFCLSQWHKDYFRKVYNFLGDDAVVVTKNGIDTRRYAHPLAKKNWLVFSSSPNRGLDRLLHLFPRIRAQVPDAELHLFYGFENWEIAARMANDQMQLAQIAAYRNMIAAAEAQGGVFWHGRVSQADLAFYQLQSKVWAYPTTFHETSCITAMECEAAGCVPVSTHLAALPETVSHGILINNPTSQEYEKTFVAWCVRFLRDEAEQRKFAEAGRRYSMENNGWDKVALRWSDYFEKLLTQGSSFLFGQE